MKANWKTVLVYCMTVMGVLLCATIYRTAEQTFSDKDEIVRDICIVIDPGHGGEDGGAVSCVGIAESTYNLDISRRLNDLLKLMGYKTTMTRERDISIYTKGETLAQKKASDLKERVKIANATSGAILVSIHQNYFGDSQYSGAQVFYAGTEGSEQLARKLQTEFVTKLNHGSRRQEKKSSGIYLMERIQCPGILVECGFLSNPQEEEKLRDEKYQKKLSSVIAATLGQHLSNT